MVPLVSSHGSGGDASQFADKGASVSDSTAEILGHCKSSVVHLLTRRRARIPDDLDAVSEAPRREGRREDTRIGDHTTKHDVPDAGMTANDIQVSAGERAGARLVDVGPSHSRDELIKLQVLLSPTLRPRLAENAPKVGLDVPVVIKLSADTRPYQSAPVATELINQPNAVVDGFPLHPREVVGEVGSAVPHHRRVPVARVGVKLREVDDDQRGLTWPSLPAARHEVVNPVIGRRVSQGSSGAHLDPSVVEKTQRCLSTLSSA